MKRSFINVLVLPICKCSRLFPLALIEKLIRRSEPIELGNKKYRGLWFLPMVAGDLIE